ncbi:MAG: carboxypeptidase-like regulatory domain-containing protein [Acidobacteriota bacterium]|jgi:hypothetical protein|nr:MAG: hypothetical protein DIU54_02420 [Acidobacteriota bacterium]
MDGTSHPKKVLAFILAALLGVVLPVSAQITTGTVAGTVVDSSGGVIPGATVVLISEARGTTSAPVYTGGDGSYTFANVAPDTYTVEVTMPGFRTLRRTGIAVSGGDRVVVPQLVIEPGGAEETINVTAEAPLIQAQSGERSYAVTSVQVENLPVNRANFTSLTALAPGVTGTTRLGGGGQNNIMMDGISAMDTGNNGQMLNMNIESIAEVKVLTSGYQAEYGRASGLQITAVTKSGTNQFRGSVYDIETNSDWNSTPWVNQKNGDPKPESRTRTWGYSIGGPVGRPGGNNQLFFFYSHEYRPTTSTINGGNPIRLRVPTALERQGDFSQSLDNNGQPIGPIWDAATGQYFENNVIPADRLYGVGLGLLNRYPLPNIEQPIGQPYNYEVPAVSYKNLTQQPAIRVDYQLSPALRVTGKYSGQRARRLTTPGTIQGFNDTYNPYPFITNVGFTVNYTLNPTTFVEATYGFIQNQLGQLIMADSANRLNGFADLPLIYEDAGVVDPRYYSYEVLEDLRPSWWDGQRINLLPNFAWGSRIANAPPNQGYPSFLNKNRTQDFAASLTKVAGRHTVKAGFYNNYSYKAQNTGPGAGGIANLTFQGYINFGNDTNNTLDTGFGYANAALGIFTQYLQASKFVEGGNVYRNTEFYIQDNWRVTNRLTLDYGMRFTHQQPQHDKYMQSSNFFADRWDPAAAPLLYVAGCRSGATVCSGNDRNAMHPITGEILTAPGAANTQAAIGTPIPGTGDLYTGVIQSGQGIAKTAYTWPTMVFAPRFGAAYDIDGTQRYVLRGGIGLFYDRPEGNTVMGSAANPPYSTSTNLVNGQLQTLGTGLSTIGIPALSVFQYDAKIPSSVQWNAGVQVALPWASSLDVSYVGQHGYNMLANNFGFNTNLNAVDFGAAYLPENQDPTLGESDIPGATAYPTSLLRPYRNLGAIEARLTQYHQTFHSIQTSLNRRFSNGFSFGANYTLSLSFKGNTQLPLRLEHTPDGQYRLRDDWAEYEKLMEDLGLQRHVLKANAVWDLPDYRSDSAAGRVIGAIINDWQLSGVASFASGAPYDLTYSYLTGGNNVNLTGSPDYAARIVYVGDPGSGCSDNQYAQFNTASVAGPTYYSLGMESGRNILRGCMDRTIDLALARNFRLGGGRNLQVRLDAFNAFDAVVINGRVATVQLFSPTDQRVLNSQYNPDGTLNEARLQPKNAGFGAATSAQNMRSMQLTVRFSF